MTKTLLSLVLLAFAITTFAQSADETAIKSVITSAYIEGIQNRGSIENIRKGFHPSFTMLRVVDNNVKPLLLEEWITNLEKAKKDNPAAPPRTEGKFISVDVTGTAAVAKLELTREGKKTFTDYLVLAKFTEGWRIISKSFYRYP
ncbi:nuclear transport factor 2 family protein [Parachryseolinea silvisoli]|nr:nuclear transport factor 2 family protein [Parachryseolinea silvisoli]MCD9019915.1 nuclear transport factor 2 family protein [Parachryseolinea silvisoli]